MSPARSWDQPLPRPGESICYTIKYCLQYQLVKEIHDQTVGQSQSSRKLSQNMTDIHRKDILMKQITCTRGLNATSPPPGMVVSVHMRNLIITKQKISPDTQIHSHIGRHNEKVYRDDNIGKVISVAVWSQVV